MVTNWRDLISHLFAGISPQDTQTPPPVAAIPLLYSPSNRSNSPPGGDQFEFCSSLNPSVHNRRLQNHRIRLTNMLATLAYK